MYLFGLEINRGRTANSFRKKKLDISDGFLVSF